MAYRRYGYGSNRSVWGRMTDFVFDHIILAIALGFIFLYFLAVPLLYPEGRAASAVEKLGFTDVEVVDRDVLFIQITGCGEDDNVKFEVEATNPAGDRVKLDVCGGLFKGMTVRS